MPFTVHEVAGLSPDGGSDHVPFLEAGVPAFFWRQSGEADYRFVHHTQHDVAEHVRSDYQRHSALVVAVGAYNLARLPKLLDRTGLILEPPRRLGVTLEGLRVVRVDPGGVADRAGWQPGDVVVAVDGVEVADRASLLDALRGGPPRRSVRLSRSGLDPDPRLDTVLDWGDPRSED